MNKLKFQVIILLVKTKTIKIEDFLLLRDMNRTNFVCIKNCRAINRCLLRILLFLVKFPILSSKA